MTKTREKGLPQTVKHWRLNLWGFAPPPVKGEAGWGSMFGFAGFKRLAARFERLCGQPFFLVFMLTFDVF
jgi:hypothetical protein